MEKKLSSAIAPCGMDCALCVAYQREKKPCAGCRGADDTKPAHCVKCVIKNCEKLRDTPSGFCYGCAAYPCRRLKQLDARYRGNYGMSMLENLDFLRDHGMDLFLARQAERWTCPACGELLCVHRDHCLYCGAKNT